MTERELYEFALIEMNKTEAPSLLLEDFNYYINKAVQQYINKVYNRYDINQQSSDDLRVLKATAEVKLTPNTDKRLHDNDSDTHDRKIGNMTKKTYSGVLPADYVHILNCIVDYDVLKNFKCYRAGDAIQFAAKRLTADMAAGILHNAYMRPEYKRPYFYINNVNDGIFSQVLDSDTGNIDDYSGNATNINSTNVNVDQDIIDNHPYDSTVYTISNPDGNRVANASKVRIEIRFGNDDSIFKPTYAYIDYIKAPMYIELTYDQILSTEDTTRVLEFPDYVCFEIVNEFVKLLMENASDPRLQTNYAVNQTILDPLAVAQQQQQTKSRDKS